MKRYGKTNPGGLYDMNEFSDTGNTNCMQRRARVKSFLVHGRLVWVCVATTVMHSVPTRAWVIRTLFGVTDFFHISDEINRLPVIVRGR